MIAWLARELQQRQWNTGIVSRGYGSRDGHPNDEARELAELLPKVPHVQDRDRVAAARRLLERHPGRLVLLDDGFQHRRLHRDIDIVLIDALQPDGFGHVFPRGTLREPMDGLRRADVAILTRSNRVPEARRREIQNMILQTAPEILWAESEHRPIRLVNGTGQSEPLSALHGKRVSAFCAIGNPDAFFQSIDTLLKDTPSQLVTRHAFPDHHHYDEQDIAMLAQQIRSSQSDVVVCTGKDLVKMRSTRTLGQRPLYALAIEFSFHSGEAELMQLIDQRLHCITGP